MPNPASREEQIFNAALQFATREERSAYLKGACAGDAALLQRVETLLLAHERAGASLDPDVTVKSFPSPDLSMVEPISEKTGDRIGRYKLLQEIGEGGCGVVYMAEQEEPVRRRVALKVIKLGMDTKQVIARFEAERQALALMDHPNIAKVLDAGATETGRPYFVMELVRGVPITEYCDQNNLSTRERLDLFIEICRAIQHAHQKGIIHRDIKPSNVLVTLHDGMPVPKVIDFGIAKATTGQRLTDKTLFTAFEQFIGTPAYMSPEQAEMSGLDIDTRSDIYALGVLLYELLTGRTPFDAKRLVEAGIDEVRRIIREEEPPRPSTRISTLDASEQTTIAKRRGSEPPKLIHTVRGDLDWIVMKAMEKDRTRRYETANGLSMDIQRYLTSEPVVARPPSNLYRFQKLVRRNKLAFTAASAVAAALVIGLGISTWLFLKEREARQHAVAAEQKANTEADKSRQVAQFLRDMLRSVRPSVALGRDTTMLREILDRTAERVDKDLNGQPDVQAELRSDIGEVYWTLGKYEQAEVMVRAALEAIKKVWGNEHPNVAKSLTGLAVILLSQDKLAEAEALQREALAMQRKLLGNENPDVANSLGNLAEMVRREGKLVEAENMVREALAIRKKVLGNEDPNVANSLQSLSVIVADEGRPADAEPMMREALAMLRKLVGNDHLDVAHLLHNLGWVLRSQGKLAEAENMYREALVIRKKMLGNEHPDVTDSLKGLAFVLREQGNWAEAEAVQREILAVQRNLHGNEHPEVLTSFSELALLVRRQGRFGEAEAIYNEELQIARSVTNSAQIGNALASLTLTLLHDKRFAEAEPLARELLASNEKAQPGQWHNFTAQGFLGEALLGQRKYAEAEPLLLSAYEGMSRLHREGKDDGSGPPRLKEAIEALANLCETSGKPEQAAEWKRKWEDLTLPSSYSNSVIFIPK